MNGEKNAFTVENKYESISTKDNNMLAKIVDKFILPKQANIIVSIKVRIIEMPKNFFQYYKNDISLKIIYFDFNFHNQFL